MSGSISSIAFISMILCLSALTVQTSAACIHTFTQPGSAGIYNLCAFTKPFTIDYNIAPYFNATLSFSLNKAATPACNQTSSVWGTITNHGDNTCKNIRNANPDNIFGPVGRLSAAPGIVIAYPNLEDSTGSIQVTLRCNQTAPATPDVNFFVDRLEDGLLFVTGYSYYGCPVKVHNGSFLSL